LSRLEGRRERAGFCRICRWFKGGSAIEVAITTHIVVRVLKWVESGIRRARISLGKI